MTGKPISRNEWVAYGITQGWVSRPYCLAHEHPGNPIEAGADFGIRWQLEPCEHVLPLITDGT